MRGLRSLVPLLLLLALTPVADAKGMALPSPTAGDFFDMTTTIAVPGMGAQSAVIHSTIDGRESITSNGTSYDSWRSTTTYDSNISAGGMSIRTNTNAKSWIRASDGAIITSASTTQSTSDSPYFPGSTSHANTTYAPPCAQMQWPLEVGKAWTSTCTSTTTSSTSGTGASGPHTTTQTTVSNYTILRAESVTVAAGTFDAFVLKTVTNGTATYQWWSPKACTAVKTSFDESGGNYTAELKAYRCANSGSSVDTGGSTGATTGGSTTTTPPADGSTTSTTATSPTPTPTKASPSPGFLLVLAAGAAAIVLARKRS
jgi:hypothetical protein